METFLLTGIAVLLYLILQELRVARDHAAIALLRQTRLAEQRIKKLTDDSLLKMVDEVRQAQILADWGKGPLGG